MCQLCAITKDLNRWPKPVEVMKTGLGLLVENAHQEHESWQQMSKNSIPAQPPHSLLEVCRLLSTMIESVDEEREQWWTSDEKRAQRHGFELEGKQQMLTNLQKINNSNISDVALMKTKLGKYVFWTLGLRGGLEELEKS